MFRLLPRVERDHIPRNQRPVIQLRDEHSLDMDHAIALGISFEVLGKA
jgi:hypothetical protein